MREFIERVVALAPDAFVLAIAAGQVLAGVALALGRGALLWLGVVGAACFLVAISWLGVGAAFPTNLVLAAGVLALLRARRPAPQRDARAAATP
jgi:membrane protein implicated in regulation of membrane protease activity